jgi:hypothetical protein
MRYSRETTAKPRSRRYSMWPVKTCCESAVVNPPPWYAMPAVS